MNETHGQAAAKRGRVLVTGCGGAVGKAILPFLHADGWTVRGFDRQPADGLDKADGPDEMVVGDLTQLDRLQEAMRGVDVLIHLAAYPNPADFVTVLVPSNVIGLYNTLHAAAEANVQRIILTSTVQVVNGLHGTPGLRRVEDAMPNNHYGLTKQWAEDAGKMHARLHKASVIAVRLGWLPRVVETARHIHQKQAQPSFLSHDDAGRFYTAAASASRPVPGECAVLYCMSRTPADMSPRYDLEPSRQVVGYEPQDVYPHGLPWPADEVLLPAEPVHADRGP